MATSTSCVCIIPGQLGVGGHNSYATPRKVKLPANHTPAAVSCGPDCSIIITSTGQLLASGHNKYVGEWVWSMSHIIKCDYYHVLKIIVENFLTVR